MVPEDIHQQLCNSVALLVTRAMECQLEPNRIMAVTSHRSEKQMRQDYCVESKDD